MVRTLGNYGSREKYVFDHLGRNSRIDELQAAVLSVKLRHLDAANRRRKEIAAQYTSKVKHPDIVIPEGGGRDSVWHIFPVLSPRRDELRQYLLEHGVQTEIHYPIPPHQQRCYQEWNALKLPVTEKIHQQELSLPCHQAMTDNDVATVISLLSSF